MGMDGKMGWGGLSAADDVFRIRRFILGSLWGSGGVKYGVSSVQWAAGYLLL